MDGLEDFTLALRRQMQVVVEIQVRNASIGLDQVAIALDQLRSPGGATKTKSIHLIVQLLTLTAA